MTQFIKDFLSAPWNAGVGAWAAVIGTLFAGTALFITLRHQKSGGGRGGNAIVKNADGEAHGGKGGSGGGKFGPGGDGGNAKVVGGNGKAIGGEGGNGRS